MKRQKFEIKLLSYLLIATLLPACLLVATLLYYDTSIYLIGFITLLLLLVTGISANKLYEKIQNQFLTLSNILEAITKNDYTMRSRYYNEGDALGQLVKQINQLSDTLSKQKTQAAESQQLVKTIVQQIHVAIIALDEHKKITLANPEAQRLFGRYDHQIIGHTLDSLNINLLENIGREAVKEFQFPGRSGHFQIIKDQYFDEGKRHDIYFLTDIKVLLRKQERESWQKLVRVLSHEINNSLAPISSFAGTIRSIAKTQSLEQTFAEQLNESLSIIAERANGLKNFIDTYRQLTNTPSPNKQPLNFNKIVHQIASLFDDSHFETQLDVQDEIVADATLLEQVLINLIKNAKEAQNDSDKAITIKSHRMNNSFLIEVMDKGSGIQNSDNLFTPFYTTKKSGSGIGLALCRQIIDAHDGFISITNRKDTQGCTVSIELPVEQKKT
ncbi:sensor histidine kinase [Pleionea sediminis]|uniref:sensor histidine kinase n=1 Tax=Pleionea sediminis TaxID=2569479 RepID=UPI001184E731|nr:ATP-binding protein [Pleionea sediminis]